ncbi:MFS transporter [Arthrobacter crystallopoietes]|uniref:Cyanate permease n=1 Tax=Crystallibacter crystallopoietes TaxID=37928 RepID=A0A1H1ANC6_9MICC|nr:MFS transporter [Arthrobacter crystallopoietes]AUI51461.1 MFS transporter [Arthrobacter crystallopoietes]SDQ41169.1 Cyanate permease [Arthrobacter crystallopoietes]
MTAAPTGRPVVTLLQAVSVTTTGVLPAFLLGALAVQIRDDLNLGPALMGIAAATLFAVSGIFARPLGCVVQRLGAGRGMAISAGLAVLALAGAGAAPSFPILVAALFIGGMANSMAQPAANLGISRSIGDKRLGLAFGIKQSAIPAASILGGLAVPTIGLVLGWRYAFFCGAVVAAALAVWALARGQGATGPAKASGHPEDRGTPRAGLVVLTLAGGLAAAAATSLGVFLVDSSVQAGISPSAAGLLFAGAALLGLLIRVFLGALMDRMPTRSPYILIANLLVAGVFGYLLLSVGSHPLIVIGSLLAFGAGWTWTGLLHFAVVRDNRLAAASATGAVQTGLSLGSAVGPLLFGFLVSATSYSTAWVVAGMVALAAAITFRIGRRLIRKSRGMPVFTLRRKTVSPTSTLKSTSPKETR